MPGALRNAIVLLSGGLDSATTLAIAREAGFACHAITFDYGQRHRVELESAARVARAPGVVKHVVMTIDLRAFGGSALTADIDVPKDRLVTHPAPDAHGPPEMQSVGVEGAASEIPVTYVPARNTIFLSLALGYAEAINCPDIFIGVNAVDYSGYPDCRPQFIMAFEYMANLATKMGVEGRYIIIHTPLINMTKAQIIQKGIELGVDYSLTMSCYDPDPQSGKACGHCDACLLRAAGFRSAGIADPALGKM
jgi:7-cyano-7-deazaguanine synthase